MPDRPRIDLEIPLAGARKDGAIALQTKARHYVAEGFVNPCQERQEETGEQPGADAVPSQPKCCRAGKYRDQENDIVNPAGRKDNNDSVGVLGLLNQQDNPPSQLGGQWFDPTLNVERSRAVFSGLQNRAFFSAGRS